MSMLTKVGVICAFILGLLVYAPSVDAAYLYMQPESQTVDVGEEFVIDVVIDTEGAKPTTADSWIAFDPSKLKYLGVVDVEEGEWFFPKVFDKGYPQRAYVGAFIKLGSEPVAGEDTMAQLRFKTLESGNTIVDFLCTPGESTDSNISLKQNSVVVDIIDCSITEGAEVFIGGENPNPTDSPSITQGPTPTSQTLSITPTQSPSPTSTPSATVTPQPTTTPGTGGDDIQPTPTDVPTFTPTPSVLPETGIIETTSLVIGAGIVLTLISLGIKIFVL